MMKTLEGNATCLVYCIFVVVVSIAYVGGWRGLGSIATIATVVHDVGRVVSSAVDVVEGWKGLAIVAPSAKVVGRGFRNESKGGKQSEQSGHMSTASG